MSAPPTLELAIAAVTPSLNAIANRRQPWSYPRLRAKWDTLLEDALWLAAGEGRLAAWPMPPAGRVRVTIERASPQRIDPDNVVGGVKPVLDGLRSLGVLADDSPDAIELVVRAVKGPTPATRIVLELLEDPAP
jgi:hypothetical protein